MYKICSSWYIFDREMQLNLYRSSLKHYRSYCMLSAWSALLWYRGRRVCPLHWYMHWASGCLYCRLCERLWMSSWNIFYTFFKTFIFIHHFLGVWIANIAKDFNYSRHGALAKQNSPILTSLLALLHSLKVIVIPSTSSKNKLFTLTRVRVEIITSKSSLTEATFSW